MKIIHIVKLVKGHSSGFNKQIPSIVKNSTNSFIYSTGSIPDNIKEKSINFISLLKLIASKQKVILHFHSLLSLKSVFIAFISLIFNNKIVYSPRGEFRHSAILSNSSFKKILFFRLIKPILNKSNIHFLSEVEYSEYVFLNGNPIKYKIIPNAILDAKEQIKSERLIKTNEFKILYVGRILVELKNIRLLVSSCAQLQKKLSANKDIKLKVVLVGSYGSTEDENKLLNLIKKHNVQDIVEIIGEVPNSEIGTYMKNADLLYNLSFSEGFPNIVLEALLFNLPILCSHNTGIQHYFPNNKIINFCSLSSTDFIDKTHNIITSYDRNVNKKYFDISRFTSTEVQSQFFNFYSTL